MSEVRQYLVSSSGQMSLPAAARPPVGPRRRRTGRRRRSRLRRTDAPPGRGSPPLWRPVEPRRARRLRAVAGRRPRTRHNVSKAVLDDHLLRDLLSDDVGSELASVLADHEPATTNLCLVRLCRSVVAATGRTLTGSWSADARQELGRRLVALPDDVAVVPMRAVSFRMAELAHAHRLSALSAEAAAASEHLDAPLCVLDRRRRSTPPRPRSLPSGATTARSATEHSQRLSRNRRSPGPEPLKEAPCRVDFLAKCRIMDAPRALARGSGARLPPRTVSGRAFTRLAALDDISDVVVPPAAPAALAAAIGLPAMSDPNNEDH